MLTVKEKEKRDWCIEEYKGKSENPAHSSTP